MLPVLPVNDDEMPPRNSSWTAREGVQIQDAAIRFIQSQIGGPNAALKSANSLTRKQVDF